MNAKTVTFVCALFAAGLSLQACGKSDGDGASQKTAGKIESAAGSLTGSEELKKEGKKDETVGGVKETVDDVKDTVHDATH